jgi:hypothetical protein
MDKLIFPQLFFHGTTKDQVNSLRKDSHLNVFASDLWEIARGFADMASRERQSQPILVVIDQCSEIDKRVIPNFFYLRDAHIKSIIEV